MDKTYTLSSRVASACVALLLGTWGFSAQGAPTVKPANNSVVPDNLYNVDVIWDSPITIAEAGPIIKVTANGENQELGWVSKLDQDGETIWDEDEPYYGISLSLEGLNGATEAYPVAIEIPAGYVKVNGADSEALNLSYTVVPIEDNIRFNPPKASTVSNVKTITMYGEGMKFSRNSGVTESVTFGDWSDSDEVTDIVVNSDGSVTFNLPKTYSQQTDSPLQLEIPYGYFDVTVGKFKLPCPNISTSVFIKLFDISPAASWEAYTTPIGEFTIYSLAGNIEFLGTPSDVKMYDTVEYTEDSAFVLMCSASDAQPVTGENDMAGIKFTFPQTYDKWGGVQFVIPANTLKLNGEVYTEEISFEYYIHIIPKPVATPADNSYLSQLDRVTVDFGSAFAESFALEEGDLEVTISYNGGTPQNIYDFISYETETVINPMLGTEEEVNVKLVLDFSKAPYTQEGTYTITVPEGAFHLTEYDYEGNAELALSYKVGQMTVFDGKMTSDPISGSYMTFLGNVLVSWEGTELQEINVDKSKVTVTVDGESVPLGENDDVKVVSLTEGDEGTGETWQATYLEMYFESLFLQTGEVRISVAQGAVNNGKGGVNPAFDLIYYLYPAAESNAVFSPANSKVTEGEITVSWEGRTVEGVTHNSNWAYCMDVNAEKPERINLTNRMSVKDGKLSISVKDLANGSYSLVLTEGTVVMNGAYINGEAYYDFTLTNDSGVASLDADEEGLYKVYNFQGVNMLTTHNADDLKALDNGLYIINGRKVILRK